MQTKEFCFFFCFCAHKKKVINSLCGILVLFTILCFYTFRFGHSWEKESERVRLDVDMCRWIWTSMNACLILHWYFSFFLHSSFQAMNSFPFYLPTDNHKRFFFFILCFAMRCCMQTTQLAHSYAMFTSLFPTMRSPNNELPKKNHKFRTWSSECHMGNKKF